ncbi:MAG: universal stress protein [Syntrophomonadaceae bacterium]|nr:universal stress protein [Syntrophomonadaceae bacterium]
MSNPIFKKVLLAVDNSEQSERAAQKAIELFQVGQISEIVVFNVYNTSDLDVTKLSYQEKLDEKRGNSLITLKQFAEKLDTLNIPNEIKRAGGDPASLILDLVDNEGDFDLIIMGSRRLNKFQELALGSVTDKVTRLVNLPVLVIK